ncbi:MAG: pilus assembly protein [Gammaproteobacteria bacterium]
MLTTAGRIVRQRIHTPIFALIAGAIFLGNANATPLDLPTVPLFLVQPVAPNVFFTLDDSGSMDWEIMTSAHWTYGTYDPDPVRNGSSYNDTTHGVWKTDGLWRSLGYQWHVVGYEWRGWNVVPVWAPFFALTDYLTLFDNDDNTAAYGCDVLGEAEACNFGTRSPAVLDWRVLSADFNRVYYNPDTDYRPWQAPCRTSGTQCDHTSLTSHTTFRAARSNPREATPGYDKRRDLAAAGYPVANGGAFRYEIWVDNRGYTGSRPQRGSITNATSQPNDEVDLWDNHVRIELHASRATVTEVSYRPTMAGLGERDRATVQLTNGGACYNALGRLGAKIKVGGAEKTLRRALLDGDRAWSSANAADATTNEKVCRTIAQAQQNAANWYTYYRRRSFVAKGAVAGVVRTQPDFRFGLTLINDHTALFKELPAADATDYTAHNEDLLRRLVAHKWGDAGTPLREALLRTGDYFASQNFARTKNFGKDDPITSACQRNFNVLMTDGYYNGPPLDLADIDDDGVARSGCWYDSIGSCIPKVFRTLADVTHHYYKSDLSAKQDKLLANALDPLETQHLNTFTVAFGVKGKLTDTDNDGWPNVDGDGDGALDNDKTLNEKGQVIDKDDYQADTASTTKALWGDPTSGGDIPEKIDDLWHAAYNSRGGFASAETPQDLVDALLEAVDTIEKLQRSASPTEQSSTRLRADSYIYRASFDSNDWSGDLIAAPIQDGSNPSTCTTSIARGRACPAEWSAATKLMDTRPGRRQIITLHPGDPSDSRDNPRGIPFRWRNLSADQKLALRTDPATSSLDTRGGHRLSYIRGNDQHETGSDSRRADNLKTFRPRNGKKLGDIVKSAPLIVAAPPFTYRDNIEASKPYSAFRRKHLNRTPIVYVGANDGAMHAFDASTSGTSRGSEVMAYIPNHTFAKLAALTAADYNTNHQFLVDGELTYGDVLVDTDAGNDWHTVLVGGLGRGGQGLFALNVTNPGNISASNDPALNDAESNASDIVLWEFTDAQDADLGYTMARPSIIRMNNDEWAVVLGNGYNSIEADGAQGSGSAALFILFIEEGIDGEWTLGNDFVKIDTGAGDATTPNGLAEVTAIDTSGDYNVDYIYGGDLHGNVWKFDVRSSRPSEWTDSNKRQQLFITQGPDRKPQPITVRPTVIRHPKDSAGVLVVFGTGKYLEAADNHVATRSVNGADISTEQTQSIYAIYDPLDGRTVRLDRDTTTTSTTHPSLLQQQIIYEDTSAVLLSKRQIQWATQGAVASEWSTSGYQGWFVDLIQMDSDADTRTVPSGAFSNEGRRIVVKPVVRPPRIIFVVTIPSADECSFGGDSIVLALNGHNGGNSAEPVFDVNDDGAFDSQDLVSAGGASWIVAGRKIGGLLHLPSFINQTDLLVNAYAESTRGLREFVLLDDPGLIGRQSWRQLLPQSQLEN